MKFRTEIKNIVFTFKINHKDKILLLGSCFSGNISEKLEGNKFKTLSNPFGIVYNPVSITKIIDRIVNKSYPKRSEFVKRDDLWHHFDFHGDMSGEFIDEISNRINRWIDYSFDFLKKANVVFITYGTSIVHQRSDNQDVVANNHKFPAETFTKRRLEIDEIEKSARQLIRLIKEINAKAKIVFTISPVRHIKSGLIENQRSKSALILSVDKLINNKDIFYFPSYELLLDDLRDYRYFNSDLVHPSSEAIEYIWEKFSESFFNKNTIKKNIEIEKIIKSFNHRPFNSGTKSHQLFLKNLIDKVEDFSCNNPELNFTEELKSINEMIN